MKPISCPPEFDAIKIERQTISGRVKNTDSWVVLNHYRREWLEKTLSQEMIEVILSWKDLFEF